MLNQSALSLPHKRLCPPPTPTPTRRRPAPFAKRAPTAAAAQLHARPAPRARQAAPRAPPRPLFAWPAAMASPASLALPLALPRRPLPAAALPPFPWFKTLPPVRATSCLLIFACLWGAPTLQARGWPLKAQCTLTGWGLGTRCLQLMAARRRRAVRNWKPRPGGALPSPTTGAMSRGSVLQSQMTPFASTLTLPSLGLPRWPP